MQYLVFTVVALSLSVVTCARQYPVSELLLQLPGKDRIHNADVQFVRGCFTPGSWLGEVKAMSSF